MAHYINGFIARFQPSALADEWLSGRALCALGQGFSFIPVIDEFVESNQQVHKIKGFNRLTQQLLEWAETWSSGYPITYIETEYFGGEGEQAAVAWSGGHIAVGPIRDSTDSGNSIDTRQHGAINECLRFLGVLKGAAFDEFDALGLGRHRTNQGWIEASKA